MRRFVLWAGIFSAATVSNPAHEPPISEYRDDPRLARLNEFFERFGPPSLPLAPDFLAAADRNNLDWRLLPSICVVESGGGKTALRNNLFGWDSGRREFATLKDGIYFVASRLAHSKLYKNKELDELLATYNSLEGYAARVKSVMRLVDSTAPLRARSSVSRATTRPCGLPRTARLAPAP